jgi:hypothetical protein
MTRTKGVFPSRADAINRNVFVPGLVLLSVALLWGCGDASGPTGTDPERTPTTLTAVEGMASQAPAGTVLPDGPTVEVLDQDGNPMSGVSVSFQVVEGGGIAAVSSRNTNALGRARIPWILGREPGVPQRLRASVGGLSVVFEALAIAGVPGESYLGRNGYTEYLPGDMPLVVSAPHGGELRPAEIPDRTWGTTVQDRNTLDLALRIRSAVRARTGFYPFVILSRLHRIKLDPNREIVEAAQEDSEAERAWWEFQTYIVEAEAMVEETFGDGLYIDLHGHGHDIQRLELGYMLSSSDLNNTDQALSTLTYVNKSSFKALGQKAGVVFADLIRGPSSLGTLFEAQGFPAVPSQSQPNPGGQPFFSGGYNTGRHGSRDGGSVSGVQIECNYTGVRDTDLNRQAFAEGLAEVLSAFFPVYFERDLSGARTENFVIPVH